MRITLIVLVALLTTVFTAQRHHRFLRTLTDDSVIVDPKFSNPFKVR
jgi:hypothetical protein